jgi:hemerythrin-like domain-containing protein
MAKTRAKASRGAARRAAPKRTPLKRSTKASARKQERKRGALGKSKSRKTVPVRSKRGSQSSKSTLPSAAVAVGRAIGRTVAAVAERTPWGNGRMDAIELLETDHRRLEDLLKKGEETTARAVKGRTELLDTITNELNAHELIEEKILYPALKSHPEAKEIVLEGYQEHHVADLLVKELHGLPRSDERWGPKLKVLKESIEHHIEEEEGDMFPTARSVMSRAELEELGARMEAMKAGALRRRP